LGLGSVGRVGKIDNYGCRERSKRNCRNGPRLIEQSSGAGMVRDPSALGDPRIIYLILAAIQTAIALPTNPPVVLPQPNHLLDAASLQH
jgi:hypothetical protein